jgi:predicted transcriptional regulator
LMHRMKYRSRTEIIRDILQTARSTGNGAGKTQLMYNAFLSYRQIGEYLTLLIDSGLLQYDFDTRRFRITEKGLSFLQLSNQIGNLIQMEDQQQW